jgi:hypothetical protein
MMIQAMRTPAGPPLARAEPLPTKRPVPAGSQRHAKRTLRHTYRSTLPRRSSGGGAASSFAGAVGSPVPRAPVQRYHGRSDPFKKRQPSPKFHTREHRTVLTWYCPELACTIRSSGRAASRCSPGCSTFAWVSGSAWAEPTTACVSS